MIFLFLGAIAIAGFSPAVIFSICEAWKDSERAHRRDECRPLAELLIDLLAQPGWKRAGTDGWEHETGVIVFSHGGAMFKNGSYADLNSYWRNRLKDAAVAKNKAIEDDQYAQAKQEFGDNVISFIERVRQI